MSKIYNWRSVLFISIVLLTPLLSAKAYVNTHVKSQDALTISSNLAQSSEAKRFQIATENVVNMNSTSSHYKKPPYKKVLFIKKGKNNMLYPAVKTDNKISIHQFP
jgi:hypothetical protein